ncbi:response regulator [Phototrophicus methaneseepsis]|uniref:Response regulator n=1 Tax=Phototrophicus methaneseepsis TaxID=2710758 RepID=A0A7S8E8I5_9CHLR|nr:response regulator [Phototrophicus methaneseepsis]QPC82238.1 response regulator [Phototrophicus methaneseepsis]
MNQDAPKKFALIIEDNESISMLYRETLEMVGFATQIVHDGQEAIDTLDKLQPDIILLDVNLPHVSGHYILRHIRGAEAHHNTPVIISTANTVIANAMQEDLAEKDILMIKPIDIRDLQQLSLRLTNSNPRTDSH